MKKQQPILATLDSIKELLKKWGIYVDGVTDAGNFKVSTKFNWLHAMTSMVPIGGNYVVDADNYIDQDALQGVITVLHRSISISILKQKIVPLDDGNPVTPEYTYLLEPLLAYKAGIVHVPYINEDIKTNWSFDYLFNYQKAERYKSITGKDYDINIGADNKLLAVWIAIFAMLFMLINAFM